MGHIRLKELPRTRKWSQVVGLIAGGADAPQVATATIDAAEGCLSFAAQDRGVVETVWLMTQLPLAARSGDFAGSLRDCGVKVRDGPGLADILGGVTDAIDARMPNCRSRTDLGEMAQMAAAETIADAIGGRTAGLFGASPGDVQDAFAKLGTVKQFGTFARAFFARFTNRCLDYFLSRALADHVGEGRRFSTLADQARFERAVETHCREASLIVEQFSGEWFSKTNYERDGISRESAAAYTAIGMRKLAAELRMGAGVDA